MKGLLEQRLEQVAQQRGWRLRWTSEPLSAFPSVMCTALDIFDGRHLLTTSGAPWCIHSRDAAVREGIARQVLNMIAAAQGDARKALPSRR